MFASQTSLGIGTSSAKSTVAPLSGGVDGGHTHISMYYVVRATQDKRRIERFLSASTIVSFFTGIFRLVWTNGMDPEDTRKEKIDPLMVLLFVVCIVFSYSLCVVKVTAVGKRRCREVVNVAVTVALLLLCVATTFEAYNLQQMQERCNSFNVTCSLGTEGSWEDDSKLEGDYCSEIVNARSKWMFFMNFSLWITGTSVAIVVLKPQFKHSFAVVSIPGLVEVGVSVFMFFNVGDDTADKFLMYLLSTYVAGCCCLLYIAYTNAQSDFNLYMKDSAIKRLMNKKDIKLKVAAKKISQIEKQLESMTIAKRLEARPPKPFTLEEFVEACHVDADAEETLITSVKALCRFYLLKPPINDAKWSYFNNYIAPLPCFEEESRWQEMQSLAGHLAASLRNSVGEHLESLAGEGESGAWLFNNLDHVNGDSSIADTPWIEEHLYSAARALPRSSIEAFDREVMPHVVRAVAGANFDPFRTAILGLSKEIDDEDMVVSEHAVTLRCRRDKSIKGAPRMAIKIGRAQHRGVPFPAANAIGDALRASLSAKSSKQIKNVWDLVNNRFDVIRLKNKFKDALEQYRSGAPLKILSPNLHINLKFCAEGCTPIVIELQVFHHAIIHMKRDSHKLYDITRAKSVADIREAWHTLEMERSVRETALKASLSSGLSGGFH